jgi:deoxyadenosine/deoxycytidine kinase
VSSYCVQPDVILYLRTPAQTCLERISERGRSEETGISLEYLEQLEKLHDEWLLNHPQAVVLDGEHWWTPEELIAELGIEAGTKL